MESLAVIPRESIRAALRVQFVGDYRGGDQTAKYQEWFTFLTYSLVEPSCGMFRSVSIVEQTFYLNPNSLYDVGEGHLMYYFAMGRLIGRALLEGRVLGFHLALPLLKMTLGMPLSFNDLEYVDPETYTMLLALLVDDGAEERGLKFCIEEKLKGDETSTHVIDLIPDGRNIDVDDHNKDEYVNRVFRYVLFESVSSQLYMFLKGVYEMVPQELLILFDPEEFDYVLYGSDEINAVAWKRKRRLRNDLSASIDIEDVIEVAGTGMDILSLFLDD
uniref:HECT-type E3 ubiquitin transferase n=1 Tax=Globisporangium ultimum (strain ATCC 200006 / CBS 805.95 / DAOM BR144) TaxID=431595 RepID=K3X484_GLOUD